MQADTAMDPDQQKKSALLPCHRRPDRIQRIEVAVVIAVESARDTGEDDVWQKQKRNGQAKTDLRCFPERHAPAFAPDQLIKAKGDMGDECGKQNDRAGQRARYRRAPGLSRLHGFNAPDAERVVGKMRRRERQQDKPAGKAQALADIAGCQGSHETSFPLIPVRQFDKTDLANR